MKNENVPVMRDRYPWEVWGCGGKLYKDFSTNSEAVEFFHNFFPMPGECIYLGCKHLFRAVYAKMGWEDDGPTTPVVVK